MESFFSLSISGYNRMWHRKISMLELAALAFLTWLFLWVMGPRITMFNTFWIACAFLGFIFYIAYISPVLIHADNQLNRGLGRWQTLYVRTDNFKPALRRFSQITIFGGASIIFAALFKNPNIFQDIGFKVIFLKLSLYLVFSAVQGLIIIFILMRLADILFCDPFQNRGDQHGKNRERILISVFITSIFSLMHMPNLPLMGITALITPVIFWQFYQTPNFFLLVCTHSILGTLLHRVYELPMRVGPFYTLPDQYLLREVFPLLGRIIGNAW